MDSSWIPIKHFFYLLAIIFCVNEEFVSAQSGAGSLYRGKYIGRLEARQHKVSGEVYAVDARTLHIRAFTYSGTGPDAFFWTGFTEHPSPDGIIVPDEKGTKAVLGKYDGQDVTITLPDGLTLKDVKWFGVWCRAYEVNFGDLYIPADLDYPQPHVIGSLNGGATSGPIVVVDAQTILVPDFTFDGQAQDAHFWVGRGNPGSDGVKVPDETGGDAALVKSDKKTMVLSLPGDLTIFDIDYFGVYSRTYNLDFGHIRILPGLNVPPSLRMLGVTPQTKLNCEVLLDDLALEIRWAVAGESIVMQLVGKVEDRQYMSFGLSGDDSRSQMIEGDTVVAWFDKAAGRGHVVDYYLDAKSQCSGRRGSCPDSRIQAEANNVRLLSATVVNGFTMITFQRPLQAHDVLDKPIYTNGSQSVIWAVGPVNERDEASYHILRNRDDIFIDFGRSPKWNCPAPDTELSSPSRPSPAAAAVAPNVTTPGIVLQLSEQPRPVEVVTTSRPIPTPDPTIAWKVPPILCHEPEDRVFYAQMGPTGGKRGYAAITGHVGWGIAWSINGLLVPEVHVVRGRTYTFVVEGGDNPQIPARYHPFYITDDPEGGYEHKTQSQRDQVKVFAGVGVDSFGNSIPVATGRLCQWHESPHSPDSFASYGAYQRSLSLQCEEGHPGILHWTPDQNTPDTVYYQCYTHRYLGWKIKVLDSCESGDQALASSDNSPPSGVVVDQHIGETIVHETRVPPVSKLFNDIKAAEAQAAATSAQTIPTTPEVIVPSDPSPSNDKQDPRTQYQGPIAINVNKQEHPIPIPAGTGGTTVVYIINGTGPPLPQMQHLISNHQHSIVAADRPYPTQEHNPRPQLVQNANSLPFKFVDAQGHPVRIGDGSMVFYETRPASGSADYSRNPQPQHPAPAPVPHPVRYEILASTVPPQVVAAAASNSGSRNGATVQISRVPTDLLQGALVRIKDTRQGQRPEQIPLSSETFKFIEHHSPHHRVPPRRWQR